MKPSHADALPAVQYSKPMKPPCVRTLVARLQHLRSQKAQTLARIIDLERIIRSTRKTRDPRLPAFLVALPFIFLLSLIVGSICFECLSFNNTDWRCVLFIVIVNMIVTAQYQAGEQDARDSDGLRFTFLGFDADEDLNASPSRAQLRPTCHKRTLTSSPLFESENIDDVQSDALDDLELRLLSVSCCFLHSGPEHSRSRNIQQNTAGHRTKGGQKRRAVYEMCTISQRIGLYTADPS